MLVIPPLSYHLMLYTRNHHVAQCTYDDSTHPTTLTPDAGMNRKESLNTWWSQRKTESVTNSQKRDAIPRNVSIFTTSVVTSRITCCVCIYSRCYRPFHKYNQQSRLFSIIVCLSIDRCLNFETDYTVARVQNIFHLGFRCLYWNGAE